MTAWLGQVPESNRRLVPLLQDAAKFRAQLLPIDRAFTERSMQCLPARRPSHSHVYHALSTYLVRVASHEGQGLCCLSFHAGLAETGRDRVRRDRRRVFVSAVGRWASGRAADTTMWTTRGDAWGARLDETDGVGPWREAHDDPCRESAGSRRSEWWSRARGVVLGLKTAGAWCFATLRCPQAASSSGRR